MFNIRNSIYVSYPEDIEVLSGEKRTISLQPGFTPTPHNVKADANDTKAKGVVFQYNGYLEMIALEFGGDESAFFKWLESENKLWIVVSRDDDYARLFSIMLLELKARYNLPDELVDELMNIQQLKNYFTGRPTDYSISDAFKLLSNGGYTAKGGLVDVPQDLSLEYVLYLYKHGLVEKSVADMKASVVAKPMLVGLIKEVTLSIRNDIAIERKVLSEFLGIPTLDTMGEAMTAINNDPLLHALFFNPKSLDLSDSALVERVRTWTRLCVALDVDYEEEHPRQLYEHDMFYKLFETNDVDLIINNIIPFTQHSFISGGGQKFNIMLLTTLYPNTIESLGYIKLEHPETTKWLWKLFDYDNTLLIESQVFTTKKATLANLDAVKSNSQFATVAS